MSKLKCIFCFILLLGSLPISARKIHSVEELIRRVCGNYGISLALDIKKDKGNTFFEYKVKDGKLYIQGSDEVAICRGFYDYVKSNGFGIYSWSGNNISLPLALADHPEKKVISPFQNHYYFNVVTYGYTMPYWDWKRWEEEIDWMALHGVNMPLALVANEAISARVWKKLGLTNKEINNYFVGPAHLPWMRMGNISGIDGPLNNDWHKQQIDLQHKILQRMRTLGMKPICPAFAGFVPQAIKRLYPEVKLTEMTWAGAFHNWMLSPEDELFHKLGKMFIQEWEKEFGKNDFYIADSFNEMDIPFPPKEDPKRYSLLASYGEKVYNSIKAGNKDAVWVMQGWMFGYMRNIWDYKTLQALVSRVPDDKMLLLDLAVDYNKHFWHTEVNWEFYKVFYNKPWVYSVIPNMGGKNGMTGVLDFYANGHLEALHSANKGRLSAFGMAPEGIENNEVIYELLSDAGWSDKEIDVKEWLKAYSSCRYGTYPREVEAFWEKMLASVYGTFTDHPRYNWQFRPSATVTGSINANDVFYEGVEQLINVSTDMQHSNLFTYDLVQWTAAYVGGKLEILTKQIEKAYADGSRRQAVALEDKFESMMLRMDALLSAYPTTNLQAWVDKARAYGTSDSQKDTYESNARRIVTIWGPPVDDYSARIWGGLIRDYYCPRWKAYFSQKKSGKYFDFAAWEANWVEKNTGLSPVHVPENLFKASIALLKDASSIKKDPITVSKNIVGTWQKSDFEGNEAWKEMSWNISTSVLNKLKGFRFCCKEGTVVVSDVSLWADGVKVKESIDENKISSTCLINMECNEQIAANNSLKLRVKMRLLDTEQVAGFIVAVY